MVEVSVSILNVKDDKAIQTLYNLETSGISYFHIDVMDGKFVKNDTTNKMLEFSEYLNQISNLPLDVHLMVEDVESYIKSFAIFDPNIITFHLETAKNKEEVFKWIKLLKENNIRVGISIKPDTKVEEIYEYLPFVHLVLIMTVEPGEGGQKLLPNTIQKIKEIKKYIDENNLEVDIEADGGINIENAEIVKEAGANILVSGSAIINATDYKKVVNKLERIKGINAFFFCCMNVEKSAIICYYITELLMI